MATITLTIDDALVPKLLPIVTVALRSLGGDATGTPQQVARRYLAAHLRQLYLAAQIDEAARAASQTAQTAANTEAGGIS